MDWHFSTHTDRSKCFRLQATFHHTLKHSKHFICLTSKVNLESLVNLTHVQAREEHADSGHKDPSWGLNPESSRCEFNI